MVLITREANIAGQRRVTNLCLRFIDGIMLAGSGNGIGRGSVSVSLLDFGQVETG